MWRTEEKREEERVTDLYQAAAQAPINYVRDMGGLGINYAIYICN